MKKIILFSIVIPLLFTLSLQAQSTFTVADGTATSNYIPVYGSYTDEYLREQVVYPASLLDPMTGSSISAMTFHLSSSPYRAWNATFDVKLGTTSASAISSSSGFLTGATTPIYSGTLTVSNNTMTITFNTPFTYSEGNLLLEIVTVTPGGNYSSASFAGIQSAGGSAYRYSSNSSSLTSNPSVQSFIPKTTFTFTYLDTCQPLHLAVSDIIGSSAMVTWQQGHSATPYPYEVSYKAASDAIWTIAAASTSEESLMLTGLQPQTDYQVRVRTHCGEGFSDYVTASFTTECTGGYTDPVVIGTPASPFSYHFSVPVAMSYPYGYTQQLFKAEEIGGARSIDSIVMQYSYNSPVTRNLDIYLGHTSKTAFANSSDWVPLENLTLVHSGEVTYNNGGNNYWFGIPLDSAFAYNGTDNLVVAFDDNTGSAFSSGSKFAVHSTPNYSYLSLYAYSSSANINPANVSGSSSRNSYRTNIRFPRECISGGCDRANVVLTDLTDASVLLNLAAGNGATGLELQYKRTSDSTFTTLTPTGNTYPLMGLMHNTEYTVRVRSLCAGSQSSWKEVTFTTMPRNYPHIFVQVGGSGDGGSWATATGDLNWALSTALAAHNTYGTSPDVWVAQGTYYGDTTSQYAFTMVEGIYAYGGFAGNETQLSQRDFIAHPTYLDGQHSRTVLYQPANFSEATLWDGFVIQNGYSTNGPGGAYLRNGAYLYDSEILNNTGTSGGGILAQYAVIDNCRFRGNVATGTGSSNGGGAVRSSYSKFYHCTFTHNRAASYGGAIYIYDAASYSATLSNCLIANNSANDGGGIYCTSGSAIIENTTIVNNEVSSSGGGIRSTGMYRLINSVIWGNRTTTGVVSSIIDNGNPFTSLYSAVEGGYSGTGNIILLPDSVLGGAYSPKFVNPSATAGYTDNTPNPDWHLQNGSICANRGGNSYVTYYNSGNTTDLDFGTRVKNDTVDMGCYESNFYGHPLPEYGDIIYVTQNGNGTRDGSSWDNATNDLVLALNLADMYDADVWVAEGTYYGDTLALDAFTMHDGVNVYGGFAGDETDFSQRDFTAHVTVLDGKNARRILNQPSAFNHRTIWDGFTLQNGYHTLSTNGGGAANLRANSTLSNCIITHNRASYYGGGIYAYGYQFNSDGSDSIYLLNCTFSYNSALSESGGGGYISQNAAIRNCVFTHNTAAKFCGGLSLSEGSVLNCEFTHNTAGTSTGGLSLDRSTASNCLIANNTCATSGSGVTCDRSNIYNCTVVNNESNASGNNVGAGLYTGTTTYSSNFSTVTNCILWGNRNNGEIANYLGTSPVTYSAAEGGAEGDHNVILASENSGGSVFCPRFVHPSDSVGAFDVPDSADWRLANGSPCVNRGDNTVAAATDVAGNVRIQQDTIDMGCYESGYNSVALPQFGNIIYVTQQGTGTHTGESWENATSSLSDAISIAQTYGADVWVAAGTYYGNTSSNNAFTMQEGVSVYGGFAGNEPEDYDLALRDFETNTTILDGQGVRRVLYQPNDFTAATAVTWDGFTIQNGAHYDNGPGVYMLSYTTLSHCIVQYNTLYYYNSSNSSLNRYGAGVYSYSGNRTSFISDCVIRFNSFESHNRLTGYGAGLSVGGTRVVRTEISHNSSAYYGGGMTCGSYDTLYNCLIHSNSSRYGGGVYINYNYIVFSNCDIVNNIVTSNGNGGGIYRASGTPVFTNCIIWGNKKVNAVNNIYGTQGTYTYSAVEGGFNGTNNLNLAYENDGYDYTKIYVRFSDPVNGDYSLHPTSACVNAGNSDAVTDSLDLHGNPRMVNAVDIGCLEAQELGGCPSVVALQADNITGSSAHLSWHPLGTESQWFVVYGIDGGATDTMTVTDTTCTLTGLTLNRHYTARVRALCGGDLNSIFSLPVHFQTTCDPAVLDTLSNFSVMLPVDSDIVFQQNVSFSWTNLPEATSYDFYIWPADTTEPETPNLTGLTFAGVNNFSLPAYERGKYYRWKVVAWNECISKTSPVRTLRVNALPDLHVSAVTASSPVAGLPLTVTWTVSNDGEGSTQPGTVWYDRIYLARDADVREFNQDQDILLGAVANLQVLNAGESYTNTTTVTLPEGIMGNYYLFVIANQHDAFDIDFASTNNVAPNPYTPSLSGDPYPYLIGRCHSYDMDDEVRQNAQYNGFNLPYLDNFFYVVLNILPPPSPDLVVSSVAHPANTFSGTTIPMTWTVTNQGEATAVAPWYDAVYLTSDTVLNTVDAWRVGTYKHTDNLPVDSSYTRNIEVTIPIDYMGDYRFFVITDNNDEIYEGLYNENNIGESEHPLTVSLTPPADLIVTSIVMPDTVDVNTSYNILYTVKNDGMSPTYGNYWYDYVYISRDSAFSQSNARLLRRIPHTGTLAADSSYSRDYSIPFPADLEGGDWFILVYTDCVNHIFEYTYEDNNVLSRPITVNLPDLAVTSLSVPDTVDPNTTVRVTWTVRNNGPGNIIKRSFSDRILFNGETVYTANVSYLDLAAGDSMVRSANLQLSCPADDAVLSVVTDVAGAVLEGNEANNTLAVPLAIHTPDLAVTGVTLSADTIWSGAPVTVTYTVVNNGDRPVSGTVTDRIFFSQLAVGYEDADLAGIHTHTVTLAPGETEIVTATVNVPNGISGPYYCHVTGNATGTVCETNPGNNVGHSAASNVQLTPWPDIVVTNVTVEGPVHLGGTFPVQYTIANQGVAPLHYAGVNNKFYYSTSATQYDTNNLIHTQMDYLNMSADDEETFTAYMALPANEIPHNYYIHIVADATDLVYEHTDEDNNTAVSNSFLASIYQLDLMAVEIDGPDTVQWGQTTTYRLHVRNNSAVPTLVSQWRDVLYISEDQVFQDYDQLVQSVSHQAVLYAGDDYWVNFSVTIPYGAPATTYLFGYTDFYNNNPDINPFNNSVTKAITVNSVPTPDIAVTATALIGQVIAGQPAQLAYTVTNVGDQDIALQSWSDKLFLSANDAYESGDIELLTKQRPNVTLPQGSSYTDTLTFTVPLPYSGNMYLIVRANANNNPFEANSVNNMSALPVNIILTDPGDLVVTNITSEGTIVSGNILHASWNVQNMGDNLLSGNGLRSLVYLSTDMVFDANDRLIGNVVTPSIYLNPGDMIAQSAESRISGLAAGEYYLIVKTDVTNAFHEVDESNNTGCSFEPFEVTLRQLPFNTDVADVLYNDSPSDFRMDVGDQIGQTVRIHLTTEDSLAGAINMIYATHNNMGDNLNYSYSTIGQYTAQPELYIPYTQAGYYGVNVYGNTPAGDEQNTVLRADILPFELLTVDADHGGNTGEVTVELTGSHFRPDMKVCLRNEGDTLCADSLTYVNYYKAFAHFDLTGRTPGVYDVSAENFCEGESVLYDGFEIQEGEPDGLGYNLIFPSSPRPNRTVVMMLEFGNVGNLDLHNQVLEITCIGGCPIALTPEGVTAGQTTLLVPLSIEGQPQGLLRPGSYGTINIYGYTSGGLIFTLKPVNE
ncbi:MAG: fibronectin type III domain-containing protein [Bacteroidales bacterium]|nr:fibronectin type III domain-containing protein [Bacteroidales bacterium]